MCASIKSLEKVTETRRKKRKNSLVKRKGKESSGEEKILPYGRRGQWHGAGIKADTNQILRSAHLINSVSSKSFRIVKGEGK